MANHLVDKAQIKIKAGNGGDGMSSFHRAKFLPKGGPDGGDGGDGGDVYIVGEHNMATLMDFRARSHYEAENGDKGKKKKMGGRDGEDLVIKVPLGTLVYEVVEDRGPILIGDIIEHGQKLIVAKGGKGGAGNVHYKNSVNQAPDKFKPGSKGEQKLLNLEIKLVADIGLVGMPNAGKSTLINHLCGAKAKVGSYPFTTLVPNLGPLRLKTGETIVIADIPGLIAGASQGKGLGDDFLRHIERTRVLVHLIDPMLYGEENMTSNALKAYDEIRAELSGFNAGLENKPEIVAINKVDITEVSSILEELIDAFKSRGISALGISAAARIGFDNLENRIIEALAAAPERKVFESTYIPVKRYTITNLPNRRIVQE